MKYDSDLQKEIVDFLDSREDLYSHGNSHTFFFKTWPKNSEKSIIQSKRPHGDKDSISAEIYIYSSRYEQNKIFGVELKIDMYLWGYQSEETMFQGWVENIDEFKLILKAVGL